MTDRIDTQFKFSAFGVGDDGAETRATAVKIKSPTAEDPGQNNRKPASGPPQRHPLTEGVPSLLEEFLQKVRSQMLCDVDALLPSIREAGLLDSTGTFGLTALMWTARRGNAKIARLLCAEGARLDVSTAGGNDDHDDMGGGEDALILAAKHGHAAVVQLLLEQSARGGNFRRHGSPLVRRANSAGWTALTFACANGFFEVAQLCVAAGAAVEHRARDGTTPLSWASTAGNREVVALLLASGAKPVADVYQSEFLASYMDASAAMEQ